MNVSSKKHNVHRTKKIRIRIIVNTLFTMTNNEEKAFVLSVCQKIPLLSRLTVNERESLVDHMTCQNFKPSEKITYESELHSKSLVIVVKVTHVLSH